MNRLALVVLLAVLVSCKRTPPKAPTPEAIGAELATFRQLLVPISSQTWTSMQESIALNGVGHVTPDLYEQPYMHATLLVNGQNIAVMVAYTGVWLAPNRVPMQTMSVRQYMRAFAADREAYLGSVVAPKGTIYFTRAQIPDILAATRSAGASSEDIPFSVVRGAGR